MLKSFLGGVCLLALGGAAWAGDVPQYAPAPDWIRPQAIPVSASGTDGSATQTLLLNQQARLTSAGDDFYTDVATKVLSATGLSDAGSFIADWLPDTETITIHKVEIIRDGHAIDALAGGSKVTVLRREKIYVVRTFETFGASL